MNSPGTSPAQQERTPDVSTTELLPCPFCGDDQPALDHETDIGAWTVRCIHCGIRINDFAGERSARSAWNRRASQAQQPAPAEPPAVLFDGYAVLQEMTDQAKQRTSPESVSDVLDAVVRLLRHQERRLDGGVRTEPDGDS